MKDQTITRRCATCKTNWPDSEAYIECPHCETMTKRFKNIKPLDEAVAMSLKKHIEFDKFYENRLVAEVSDEPSHMPSMC